MRERFLKRSYILFKRLHDTITFTAIDPTQVSSTLSYGTYPTPFGRCLIVHHDNMLWSLSFFEEEQEETHLNNIKKEFPKRTWAHDPHGVTMLGEQIFSNLHDSIPMHGILCGSPFQIAVWKQLFQIPSGTTMSYRKVAKDLAMPQATRAVAHAIGRNNIAYIVPCHRVIGSDGTLRGYRWGITCKKLILLHENAQILRSSKMI